MTSTPFAATTRRYKAFVSYSHAADGKLAAALQAALQRFTKPWHRFRAMRVFRDETGLAVTPELWDSIETALKQSEYFILLASPLAAASKWVQEEVTWWLRNRNADQFLIVLTAGEIAWDAGASDFDWSRTDALPSSLQKAWKGEPHFGDLRWVKSDMDLSLRQPRFFDEIARLAATLLNRPLDDLIGEYRRAMRLLRTAVAGVALLTAAALAATYAGFQAKHQLDLQYRDRAAKEELRRRQAEAALEKQHQETRSTEVAARAVAVLEQDPELSRRLALEAVRIAPTHEAEHALRQTLLGLVAPMVLRGHSGVVYSVHFSADGQRVLTGGADGTVRLWDATAGTSLLTLKVCDDQADWPTGVLSSDGRKVLTVVRPESLAIGYWDSGSVQLHNSAAGDVLVSIPDRHAVDAALSNDGRKIVTAGFSPTVRIWDALTGTPQVELSGHEQRVVSASFSANDKWILTGSWDGTARVWEAATGRSLAVLQSPEGVDFAVFTPDGTHVVTLGSHDKVLRLWDWVTAPGSSSVVSCGQEGSIQDSAVSPDGKWLAIASTDKTARIWDIAGGKCRHVLRGHEEFVNGVDFSPDSRWVVTASADKTARIWEVATGEELTQLGWNRSARTSIAFSPDGKRIATGTVDGTVPVYTCAICGSVDDLVALAGTTRELTDEEKEKYLRTVP
jgi:WD40 repeat protein